MKKIFYCSLALMSMHASHHETPPRRVLAPWHPEWNELFALLAADPSPCLSAPNSTGGICAQLEQFLTKPPVIDLAALEPKSGDTALTWLLRHHRYNRPHKFYLLDALLKNSRICNSVNQGTLCTNTTPLKLVIAPKKNDPYAANLLREKGADQPKTERTSKRTQQGVCPEESEESEDLL